MPPSYTRSGHRLGAAVLTFVLGVIAVVTLEPFQFRVPHRVHLYWWANWFDVIANVALFVVPGFLYALTSLATSDDAHAPEKRRRTLQHALLYGALVSALIEATQILEPARFPSPADVASNATGAWLGAWMFFRLSRLLRSDTPLIGMFALELPLMGLVYLLIPLCSLAAMTLPHSNAIHSGLQLDARSYGMLALGCFGGVLIGHVQRYHFGVHARIRAWQSSAAAAGTYALGTIPALAANPAAVVAGTCLTACVAWLIGGFGVSSVTQADRRFEINALLRGAPFLLGYVGLASVGSQSMTGQAIARVQIIGELESYAAFTVVGYCIAEGLGRLELGYRWVVCYVALGCVALSVAMMRMHHPTSFVIADWEAVVVHAAAGAYGGWIYHLQRTHIRALVAAQRMFPVARVFDR